MWNSAICAKTCTPNMVEYQVAFSDRNQSNAKNVMVTAKSTSPAGANACAAAVFSMAFVLSCSVDQRKNRAASALYRGLGFTTLGVRGAYYADNDEDAVEMILALDPSTGRALPGEDEIRIDG